jgi:hypothetical protein
VPYKSILRLVQINNSIASTFLALLPVFNFVPRVSFTGALPYAIRALVLMPVSSLMAPVGFSPLASALLIFSDRLILKTPE